MRIKQLAPVFVLLTLTLCLSAKALAGAQPEALAHAAVSANPAESAPAIAALRAMGPSGLQTMFTIYAEEIKRHNADAGNTASTADNEAWQRLAKALDAVAQAYDSASSGLYWHTDFAAAQAEARRSGKPILSLRLLGNLNEEYSCANSRFFRAVLYSNAQISSLLRERFVLHWKSVRPVPRVTIDYGDGRKLERTLTGNSIHYILDAEGRPVDALPGLYGPQAFQRELLRAESIARQTIKQSDEQRADTLRSFHQARIDSLTQAFKQDVQKAGGQLPQELAANNQAKGPAPTARAASRRAMSKAVTEVSIIESITYDSELLAEATDNDTWNNIAALHTADAKLDPASLAIMRRQSLNTATPGAQPDQAQTREQFTRLVSNFERYLALDTARNEYLMHIKLHAWLNSYRYRDNLESLNEKVYSELFLTPRSDPWLGLFSPDTYTALENGGVKQ
ncbi:MAG: hypothetical protein QOF02_3714 [Blastocatellia bacterium]|jgi:hypothetical protein|nr:hypothetical protein [Blastocatellia bacterium]